MNLTIQQPDLSRALSIVIVLLVRVALLLSRVSRFMDAVDAITQEQPPVEYDTGGRLGGYIAGGLAERVERVQ